MSLKRLLQVSTNVAPDAVIPSTSFIWEVIIIKATAEVNPDETGPDTKSIKNPLERYF
jgi:hypothetical protein